MIKPVIGAAILSLLAIGPAFGIAPPCQDQLAQVDRQLAEKSGAKAALTAKLDEAKRLCQESKNEEAQDMAQQIRQELAGQEPSTTTCSGTSMPGGTAGTRK